MTPEDLVTLLRELIREEIYTARMDREDPEYSSGKHAQAAAERLEEAFGDLLPEFFE